MRGWIVLAVAASACLSGAPSASSPPAALPDGQVVLPGPTPSHDAPHIALLDSPFKGDFPATNGFDHDAHPPGPGAGATLAFSGARVQGTFGHRAWDWQLPPGTPILAPADGVVHQAGAMRPFLCDLLGRPVTDQLAVRIQHVAPDGQVFDTELHHLSQVDVQLGDSVHAGEVIGLSGSSGCSSGPHLHMVVWSNQGGVRAPIDPFGWEAPTDDPWSTAPGGARSMWLWRTAPHLYFIARSPPDATGGLQAVNITELWFRGWRDEQNPANERFAVRTDTRETHGAAVDLSGWKIELPLGEPWIVPAGTVIDEAHPLWVIVGDGEDARTDDAVIRHVPGANRFPDDGGILRLLDVQGALVSVFGYGKAASVPSVGRIAAGPSCPPGVVGCVPMPVDGAVASLSASEDGVRWLAVVGDPAAPVLVEPARPQPVRLLAPSTGGGPNDPGASRPHFVLDALIAYDAAAADGRRTLFFLSPGLHASEGFQEHISDPLEVLDGGRGTLLFKRGEGDAAHVWAWRVGDASPHAITNSRLPESEVHLSPDATELAFVRNGQVHRASIEGGRDTTLWSSVAASARLGWLGNDVVLLAGGQLLGATTKPLLEGLRDDVLVSEAHGRAVVVQSADGTWQLVTPDGRMRALALRGDDVGEVTVARGASGWSVAWTARFGPGLPRGLGLSVVPF